MMFKYRGTTIHLFSTKLVLLVLFTVCSIFAVFSLHEIIALSSVKTLNSFPLSNGHLDSNQPPTRLPSKDHAAVLGTYTVITKAAVNENINKTPLEERLSPNRSTSLDVERLREIIRTANLREVIRNKDKFGTDFSQSALVIIVQVHDRVDYFSHLLKSLSHAKGIEEALLIISSDLYSEEINRLVEEIDFCRVSRIALRT